MPEFFLVVPPGLEDMLIDEMREIEPFLLGEDARPNLKGFPEFKVVRGGVSFEGDAFLALQLHFFSKLASRLLLRLGRFRATEFYQLEKGLKGIDLQKWIGSAAIAVKVEAQKSKLGHEKRILEVMANVWKDCLKSEGRTLLVRNEHDEFTISLDLTGEHLHKRSVGRPLGGVAPIRETLAAGLLRFLVNGASLAELRQVFLFDPMGGSGTLLSEAANLYRPNFAREYAFQKDPWIPKLFKSPSFQHNYKSFPQTIWAGLGAVDQSAAAQERLRELAKELGSDLKIGPSFSDIRPQMEELKKSSPKTRTWVVSNPPYGERLRALEPEDLRHLLLESDPARIAVILPQKLVPPLKRVWPKGWELAELPVQNGGIPCLYLRFVKKF